MHHIIITIFLISVTSGAYAQVGQKVGLVKVLTLDKDSISLPNHRILCGRTGGRGTNAAGNKTG